MVERLPEATEAPGLAWMVCPGIDAATSRESVRIAAGFDRVRAAVGIHPSEASSCADEFGEIERLAFEPGVCAIGETGLDSNPGAPPTELQTVLFERHVSLARDLDLPLICHSRRAEETLLSILPSHCSHPVILHCYTGPADAALAAASRGFYTSFSGALTFRRNEALRETAARLPRSLVLVETDSPYMAPEPVRGRTCEPAFVVHTARRIAEVRGEPVGETFRTLLGNAERAFLQGPCRRPSVIYVLGRRAYVNLTGKCCNSCRFCIRNISPGLGGYLLDHGGVEPEEARVLGSISRLPREGLEELVFCGYGEPTARPGLLARAAVLARSAGWRLRLDTNGLMLCFSGRDEALRLIRLFDSVSISLNAWDQCSYEALCRPSPAAGDAWARLDEFVRLASSAGVGVRLTAVAFDGVDLDRVRAAAALLGHDLTVRGFR